jgi:hypothetical protein
VIQIAVIQRDVALARNEQVGALGGAGLCLKPGNSLLPRLERLHGIGWSLTRELAKISFQDGMRKEAAVIHLTDRHDDVIAVRNQHEGPMRRFRVLM